MNKEQQIDSDYKVDRRANKARGTLLNYLSHSMMMITEAWDNFSRIKVKNQLFLEELSSILIGVNSIKESCINKGMLLLATQSENLESALTELIDYPEVGDALLYEAIMSQMQDLTEHIDNLLKEYKNNEQQHEIKEQEDSEEQLVEPIVKKIFIISNEKQFIHDCSIQISQYGYSSHSFSNFDEFITGLTQGIPAAIIADFDLFQQNSTYNLIDYHTKKSSIPMIVVSSNSDFNTRFQAVQAGSTAFFTKPVNAALLLDKLDTIIYSNVITEPPKVLVIDDSKTISEFLSRTLTRVGMVVHIETTPESALSVIGTFNPDLILMDMYMPICDGEDLCRIIRQYESFTTIPIVFLSSETDINKQLNAMKIGADDFLTKEIDPQHLVASITTRIQRHRILSSFMIRDSLTGLLNHTTSKKQLEQMLKTAKNQDRPVSFAMIDIDKFKNVNDTYGHPTGDVVIKALSRILKRRLRRTDSLGRYGGEEFAVVFADINAQEAKNVLDEIREDFSKIPHIHENVTFYTTFSAGIAQFPAYNDSASISSAADRALYEAKRNGRNQICIAKPQIEEQHPDFK